MNRLIVIGECIGRLLCKLGLHRDEIVTDFWLTELQNEQVPVWLEDCKILQCRICRRCFPPMMSHEEYKNEGGKLS